MIDEKTREMLIASAKVYYTKPKVETNDILQMIVEWRKFLSLASIAREMEHELGTVAYGLTASLYAVWILEWEEKQNES